MTKCFKSEARSFMIWREGTACDWDIVAADLAEVVGCTDNNVHRICSARGWPLRDARTVSYRNHSDEIKPLTELMVPA